MFDSEEVTPPDESQVDVEQVAKDEVRFNELKEELDPAPDADDPGDSLPDELSNLVTEGRHVYVRDEVDRPPNPEEQIDVG